jgi:hypothetical protein
MVAPVARHTSKIFCWRRIYDPMSFRASDLTAFYQCSSLEERQPPHPQRRSAYFEAKLLSSQNHARIRSLFVPEPISAYSVATGNEPADSERRTCARHPIRVRAIYQMSTAQPDDFWWYANIRDVSSSGLSLHVLRRWEPGTFLATEPMIAPADAPSEFPQCRVIHAVKATEGGGWILGCEFSQPLHEDQLVALLRESEQPEKAD